MREAHKACNPLLSTVAQPLEKRSIVEEAKVETSKSIAKSMLEINRLEVKIAKDRKFRGGES